MKKLAVFEMILICIGLTVGGFLLRGQNDPKMDRSFQMAMRNGNISTSSLIVEDKYQGGGRNGQYYLVLAGMTEQEEIIRQVSRRTYNKTNPGDTFGAYAYGGGFIIPAFDMDSGDGRLYGYLSWLCWLAAALVLYLAIAVYRRHNRRSDFDPSYYNTGYNRMEIDQ
jgi:hypothetical protein